MLVVLEDHGVPDPRLLAGIRHLFATHAHLEASTFFLRNGTAAEAASRALFAWVGGFSEVDTGPALPWPVCSSFALRRTTWERERERAALQPGTLEYEVLPPRANAGLAALPRELTVTHYQRQTVQQAVAAVHWNARIAGWVEGAGAPPAHQLLRTSARYLARPVRLNRVRRRPLADNAVLGLCAIAGFAGWWIGRWRGPGDADAHLTAVHHEAA